MQAFAARLYGFGSAVAAFTADNRRERLALLQRMHRQWPFLRALLSNMDMVLAKSDLALGSRYAGLVGDAKLRKRILTMIEAEWHRTVDAVAALTGDKHPLARNPALASSMRHRFPYIDPLHHLQIELIERRRSQGLDERSHRGIHLAINGIGPHSATRGDGRRTFY